MHELGLRLPHTFPYKHMHSEGLRDLLWLSCGCFVCMKHHTTTPLGPRWWRGVEVQPPVMVGYYDLDAEIVVSNHDLDAEIVVVIRQNGEAAIAIAQARVQLD